MSNVLVGDGRTHIQSKLMRESLQDRAVLSQTDSDRDLHIFPDVSLVSIGGQSIFDRGKAAILPLVDELIEIKKDRALKLVLGVGGGTRVRHTVSIALDLGLPVGGVELHSRLHLSPRGIEFRDREFRDHAARIPTGRAPGLRQQRASPAEIARGEVWFGQDGPVVRFDGCARAAEGAVGLAHEVPGIGRPGLAIGDLTH